MEKTYIELSYSGWKFAGASTISGGVLHASHTESISNTFSGNLMVTVKALQGLIGFDTTATSASTVSYSTPDLPKLAGKGHRLEYRHVYKKYKVTQEKNMTEGQLSLMEPHMFIRRNGPKDNIE